jgi:DNA (cytosine-5)-methyltransferase 1
MRECAPPQPRRIAAIDLFCGAGGLSFGLKDAGVDVVAGIDLDGACKYPFEENLGAVFIQKDIREVTPAELDELWPDGSLRLLAGCAPCQPFSSHRRGADTREELNWSLLDSFTQLVVATKPDFVTMENVSRLKSMEVFARFVATLRAEDYAVDFAVLYGPDFGLPQERRRLVLVASRHGVVRVPTPTTARGEYRTVRETIGALRSLSDGEADPEDALHKARKLIPINLMRMRASIPGGTWADWPIELVSPCHLKSTGASFKSFYGRMSWDAPAPTITTQAYNFGTGRFGHPEQDRSLTLREAAMLQGFPRNYAFVRDGDKPRTAPVGRLIGNAVPPPFGKAIGAVFAEQASRLSKATA